MPAVATLCVCSILLYSISIQTNVFLLHKWIMMVLWIWQGRMTLQAKTIAGMLQYGELVVLGGGGVKICWMSIRCGEALDNSTGVFITTGFLWDSVPSKFESLVKKNKQTAQTQNLSWGLFWIIYIWRPIEATSQWSKCRRYIFKSIHQVKLLTYFFFLVIW